jgi:threonine dehydratase
VSGIAIAVKSQRPEIEVIGVQVETCAPVRASLEAGAPVEVDSALTIADGIAVKRPGELTLGLIRRWVDDIVVVAEDDVAEAMMFALERAKLVVEGAGAVGIAALLGGLVSPSPNGVTAVVVSGGNVDAGLLAELAVATRASRGGGWCSSPGSPIAQGRWRACSHWWPSSGPICSMSSTCARGWTCTSGRRPCSWCSRPAVRATPRSW